jgi:chaperonin cofactor prefoldin
MDGLVTHRNVPIDPTSRAVLSALAGEGGVAVARELRAAVGLERDEQVRYRLTEYLLPAGLVEPTGTRHVAGGNEEATVFSLTEAGKTFLENNGTEVGDLQTPSFVTGGDDEVGEQVEQLGDAIDDLSQTVSHLGSRLSRVEESLTEIERGVDTTNERLDAHRDAIKSTGNLVQRNGKQLDSLSADLESFAEDTEESQELVVSRIRDALEGRDEAIHDELERIRGDLKELSEQNGRRLL